MLHGGVPVRVPARAESVLLAVRRAEHGVAKRLHGEDASTPGPAQAHGVHGEVPGLEAVGEGQPDEVPEREHDTEAVRRDVHGGENGGLVPERVEDVDGLRGVGQDHAVGYVPVGAVLLGGEGEIQEEPAEHARA